MENENQKKKKAELVKEALTIVDKLGDVDMRDLEEFIIDIDRISAKNTEDIDIPDTFIIDEVIGIVKKANKIKRNGLWRL